MTRTGLVLQGGGALGAFQVGVVEELHARTDRDFAATLEVVCGVSIGAINAAVMIGGHHDDPVRNLRGLWSDLRVPTALFSRFGSRNFYRLRSDFYNFYNWTHWYDVRPLRRLLSRLIDFDKLNDPSMPEVVITAVEVSGGRPVDFSSRDGITLDHVMASSSLPPGFPMTEIENEHYWDGGLFDNTPLAPAIDRLIGRVPADRCPPGVAAREGAPSPDADLEVVVVNLFPTAAPLPFDLEQVQDRIAEIRYANRTLSDLKETRRITGFLELLEQLDRDLPIDSPVRASPRWRELGNFAKVRTLAITSDCDTSLAGAHDFSGAAIDRRIHAGRTLARRVLDEAADG